MYLTEQKDELVRRLDGTRDGLMATVAGLTEVQSNCKPSPEGWSISGIVEHLAIVEDLVILRVEQLAAGSGDSPNGKFNESDAVLFEKVVDRSQKFQAPERARPTGKTLRSSLERLAGSRAKIVEFVRAAPPGFRQHSMTHPVLGPLDGHQWLVALAAHCARHTQQIIETKTAPGFPVQ